MIREPGDRPTHNSNSSAVGRQGGRVKAVRRLCVAASAALGFPACAVAQGAPEILPDIVVTAGRVEQPLTQTGSAITVVGAQDLARSNPTSVADALRAVPGLDLTETGGPGGNTAVRLRGANAGQTLVMIDGVRVNDPSSAPGEFDFSMVPAGAIERIEVLRGPQSALYGSDAIGGVVNIITKRGSGPAKVNLTAEAGRYDTVSTQGSLLGASGPWSYAFSGALQKSGGFSRYGHRIPAIEARFPDLDRDGFERQVGYGRIGYDAGNGARLEAGGLSSWTRADFDAATGAFPDTPASASRWLGQAWTRGTAETLDGAWTHTVQAFANRTERSFDEYSYRINRLPQNTTRTLSDFIGERVGAEYQGNLKLGAFGTLIAGSRLEHESADTSSQRVMPVPLPRTPTLAGEQTTRSVFALWQVPIGERLITSVGGRIDDVQGVDRFETWRATAAYLIPETGSKLRASAGTGGKAPTLFQLYAPTFGNPGLQSEKSFGWDAGLDQSFLQGRVTLSGTVFENRLGNLIEFDITAMRYFNVAQALTRGVEAAGDVELWPQLLHLKAAYTYLHAIDLETGLRLQRRPMHTGRLALAITPVPHWLIEPRLLMVSQRFNNANEVNVLMPYARFDLYTEYRFDERWRMFARLENVTDTRYQEALNYGTAGRGLYLGASVTW
jgi:vitamin B12 transporter